jgi:hypothetical protein
VSTSSVLLHSPPPAPDGPIACTLHPNGFAGRMDDFRRGLFTYLRGIQRPAPSRLRLVLAADADPEAVRELLVREQECCAFLSFTLTTGEGRLVADLEVPPAAGPALDGLVALAELAASGGLPWTASLRSAPPAASRGRPRTGSPARSAAGR